MTNLLNYKSISSELVDSYHNDGYIVVDNVLSIQEVEALKLASESENIKSTLENDGFSDNTVHLSDLTFLHPAFLELARHPSIIKIVKSLIGENVQIHHSKVTTKPPTKGTGPIAWHQDFAYIPHTNTDLLAVMVMLDDATPENGCMKMVKGSHKRGLFKNLMDKDFTEDPEHRRWR